MSIRAANHSVHWRLATFFYALLGLAGAEMVSCRSQAIRGLWCDSRLPLSDSSSRSDSYLEERKHRACFMRMAAFLEFPSCPSCGIHDRTLGPAAGNSGRWSGGGLRLVASCRAPARVHASRRQPALSARSGISRWLLAPASVPLYSSERPGETAAVQSTGCEEKPPRTSPQ